jgi:lysozyme family protein
MAEIYTISGAHAAPAASPAPVSPAAQLQNALKALGNTTGDPNLSKVAVDGVIGPATVKAVNYALATYVGGTSAFPRADLDVTRVRQYAGALAALVAQRVQKSGGSVPDPVVQRAVRRSSSSGALVPIPITQQNTGMASNQQWVWYVVGGVSVLIALSLVAAALKKKRK